MVINLILQGISNFFSNLTASIPEQYKILISLFLYTIFIVVYVIFIWKFYRFMAEREIIKLNLKQYNYSSHPGWEKFFETLITTIEYVIILPFLVLFWFIFLSIFLLILSEQQDLYQILLIASAIIASTRITSYISENLSRELAKIFPFTVLVMFVLGQKTFDINVLFSKISQIPKLFNNIFMFILFIFAVELILRCVYSITSFIYSKRGEPEAKIGQ